MRSSNCLLIATPVFGLYGLDLLQICVHSAKVNGIMRNWLMGVKRLISVTNICPVLDSLLNDSEAGQLGFDYRETQWGSRKKFLSSPKIYFVYRGGGALFEGKTL